MPRRKPTALPNSLTREKIREFVAACLEPLPWVHALWEGGSAAFGRADVWSDLDLQACVDDDRVEDTFEAIEAVLTKKAPVETRLIIPEPTWHGHAQRFYRFSHAPPWVLLDLCVMQRSNKKRFLETEIHGRQPFLFDRIGLAADQRPLDPNEKESLLRARLVALHERVAMFAVFVDKQLRRHHPIDAMSIYHGLVLAPLVEALRIRHDPWRHDFGMRYLHEDLPQPVAKKLESLVYIRDTKELAPKTRAAVSWFQALVSELEKKPVLVEGAVPPVRASKV